MLHTLVIWLEVLMFFNLMIIVHELGHYWAARWRGLKVEKFGIWFGKPIWRKKVDDFEFVLGWIPAGGYVALPQMAPMNAIEGDSSAKELPPIKPLDKAIVAFAGPLFSLGLALVMACFLWLLGKPVSTSETTNIIGWVDASGSAAASGLQPGDQITKINGEEIRSFGGFLHSVRWLVAKSEQKQVEIEYLRAGKTNQTVMESSQGATHWGRRTPLKELQVYPAEVPTIGAVLPEMKKLAALQPGDEILEIDGTAMLHRNQVYQILMTPGAHRMKIFHHGKTRETAYAAGPLTVNTVAPGSPAEKAGLHAGDQLLAVNGINLPNAKGISAMAQEGSLVVQTNNGEKTIQPVANEEIGKKWIGVTWEDIGILWDEKGRMTYAHPSPFEQVGDAAQSIYETIAALVSSKTDIKLQHMSGPVGIMRLYYLMFETEYGPLLALWFSVIFNVNLSIINMLPLPVLDGGHILLAGIEGLIRRPIPAKLLMRVQSGFALLLMSYMLYVTFFDIQSLNIFQGLGR